MMLNVTSLGYKVAFNGKPLGQQLGQTHRLSVCLSVCLSRADEIQL